MATLAQNVGGEIDVAAYVRDDDSGHSLHLMVDGVHCGGCVQRIERALRGNPAVSAARLNLTTRRLVVSWNGAAAIGNDLVGRVISLGYPVTPYDPGRMQAADASGEHELLRCMAVAGFAAANVMLLSVAVWAGHSQGMGEATRGLLHWFSALIALPAIAWAGRPFFRSAWRALRVGHTNMDVPISLAVLLAPAMSLFETIRGGEHAYFDSAITLLFFLLIGRYLDRRARGRARSAAERLLTLGNISVTVIDADGRSHVAPQEEVTPGMRVLIAAGERVPVDGRVKSGHSELDTSLITGESLPVPVGPGERALAGSINLAVPLIVEVTAIGEDTILAEIVRLMELAEQKRGRFVSLADRIARAYAPVVHSLALVTFLGWTLLVGVAWQTALLYAIAVLIITCPCALGLAVPAVQVIASGRLLRLGVLLKSATALERFARIDTVVFDKTGTLTIGHPDLVTTQAIDNDALRIAAGLAAASRHPLARALCRAVPDAIAAGDVREIPGDGLEIMSDDGPVRLGRRGFAGPPGDDAKKGPELWLARPGQAPVRFVFRDAVRSDAATVVAALIARGFEVELLSGDRTSTVAAVADELGIASWRAARTPSEKCARLAELEAEGKHALMVGDGLNDAPALAAAHVSLSPSTAVDISQTAADAVFQGERLAPLLDILSTARRADSLVRQNFVLAFAYNLITIPVAILGLVTPLIAAICMSASSLIVVGNAMRLARARTP